MQSNRTKALKIPKSVKDRVYERDGGCCVLCGRPGNPEAHYISRGQSGLGIEENVVTLCRDCHRRYDQTVERESIRRILADYLQGQYPDWDESKLIYKK